MIGGGESTYKIPEIEELQFEGDKFNGIPDEPNILIVGGGPNGLFMALMLRLAFPIKYYPKLHINVLENRVDEENHRKITRNRPLTLNVSYITKNQILEYVKKVAPGIYLAMTKGEHKKLDLTQPIKVDPITQRIRDVPCEKLLEHRTYRTNVLEYELAVESQLRGVNIYHDNKMDTFEKIKAKYTNGKTLCIFDATGGRIFNSMEGFTKIRNVNTFSVYEGFSPVENAIKKVDNLLVVGIGETVIKTDYLFGQGLAINWSLILYYVLSFAETYKNFKDMGRFAGGRRSRRHHKRHRRSRKHH